MRRALLRSILALSTTLAAVPLMAAAPPDDECSLHCDATYICCSTHGTDWCCSYSATQCCRTSETGCETYVC
jgi:hypothetical protein